MEFSTRVENPTRYSPRASHLRACLEATEFRRRDPLRWFWLPTHPTSSTRVSRPPAVQITPMHNTDGGLSLVLFNAGHCATR